MKIDAEEFRIFLNELGKQRWLSKQRSIWVRYSFHFTDVRNAAQILNMGRIVSRAKLEKAGGPPLDIASPEVIATTDGEVKDFVRLYFRPRTPTQFHMEGIRPKKDIWKGCHCPVPVFFLFDSYQILTRDDSSFSEVNLAIFGKNNLLATTAAELREFDFRKIFHVGWFSDDSRQDIISHRNAEIVVSGDLDLTDLKFIYCRTPAEKETLISLLSSDAKNDWASKIIVATSADLFIRDRVFINKVDLTSKGIVIHFSPEAKNDGPFELKVVRKAEEARVHRYSDFYASGSVPIAFETEVWAYEVEVYLDNNLAFSSSYDGIFDMPF